MQINEYLINDTPIYCLKTKKFKTNLFGFSFILPLSNKFLPEFTLLAQLWTKYTCSFKTEREFSLALNELYDSQIFYNFEKKGKVLQITFYLHIINDQYINDNRNFITKVFDLFKEVVFNEKNISEIILRQEQNIYNETFESKMSNFLYLTNVILFHNMFKNENYLNHLDVESKSINNITLESLNEAYDLIMNAARFGFVIGDVKEEVVYTLFYDIPKKNNSKPDILDYENKNILKQNIQIIPENLPQSTLMLGLRTNILLDSKYYYAMCVLNNYLGGGYDSLLLKVLREQYNLVYQINSEYDWFKGILIINCGLSYVDYDLALTLINQCIKDIQNGKIDLNLLAAIKTQMISNQLEIEDNLISLIEIINQKYFYGSSSIDNVNKIEKIKNVTADEIIEAAKKLTIDSIVLFGKDN